MMKNKTVYVHANLLKNSDGGFVINIRLLDCEPQRSQDFDQIKKISFAAVDVVLTAIPQSWARSSLQVLFNGSNRNRLLKTCTKILNNFLKDFKEIFDRYNVTIQQDFTLSATDEYLPDQLLKARVGFYGTSMGQRESRLAQLQGYADAPEFPTSQDHKLTTRRSHTRH